MYLPDLTAFYLVMQRGSIPLVHTNLINMTTLIPVALFYIVGAIYLTYQANKDE